MYHGFNGESSPKGIERVSGALHAIPFGLEANAPVFYCRLTPAAIERSSPAGGNDRKGRQPGKFMETGRRTHPLRKAFLFRFSPAEHNGKRASHQRLPLLDDAVHVGVFHILYPVPPALRNVDDFTAVGARLVDAYKQAAVFKRYRLHKAFFAYTG